MRQLKSCGVLLFRDSPERSFLLMKHADRYDLPKGHIRDGESEQACALRELEEETGISPEQIRLDPAFRFATTYHPRYERFGGDQVEKTLVVFLGHLTAAAKVHPIEHQSYEWFAWNPPHTIQAETIDPLLAEAARFLITP